MQIPEDMASAYVYLVLMGIDGAVLTVPHKPGRPAGILAFMTEGIALGIARELQRPGIIRARVSEAIRIATDRDLALYLFDHDKGKYFDLTGHPDCTDQPAPVETLPANVSAVIYALLGRFGQG
jgi:hypothetical protein